jgi:hypothetical protein
MRACVCSACSFLVLFLSCFFVGLHPLHGAPKSGWMSQRGHVGSTLSRLCVSSSLQPCSSFIYPPIISRKKRTRERTLGRDKVPFRIEGLNDPDNVGQYFECNSRILIFYFDRLPPKEVGHLRWGPGRLPTPPSMEELFPVICQVKILSVHGQITRVFTTDAGPSCIMRH